METSSFLLPVVTCQTLSIPQWITLLDFTDTTHNQLPQWHGEGVSISRRFWNAHFCHRRMTIPTIQPGFIQSARRSQQFTRSSPRGDHHGLPSLNPPAESYQRVNNISKILKEEDSGWRGSSRPEIDRDATQEVARGSIRAVRNL